MVADPVKFKVAVIKEEPSFDIKSYCTDSGCVDSYLADGWGGQRIIVFPSLDLVVVFTGGNYATHEPVHEMVCEYILPAVQ